MLPGGSHIQFPIHRENHSQGNYLHFDGAMPTFKFPLVAQSEVLERKAA